VVLVTSKLKQSHGDVALCRLSVYYAMSVGM